MATVTSGSFNTTAYSFSSGTRYLTFSWSIAEQSIINKTTTISWSLVGGGTYKYNPKCGGFRVVIDGVTVYEQPTSYRIEVLQGTVVASGTYTLQHDGNGNKSFSAYAEAGISTVAVNCSGSGSWDLKRIPQPSTVSCPNSDIGSNTTIVITREETSFTHTLTYSFNGESSTAITGTIAEKTGSASVSWKIPTEFYDKIPNSKNGICTITCETYVDDTLIGSTTTTFTATANQNACSPKFEWWYVSDDNLATRAVTGNPDVLVRYQSTAKAAAMAWAKNGANLSSLTVTNGSNTASSSGTEYATVSMYVSGVSTPRFIFTAIDSRGYSSTEIIDAPMVDYVNLTCVLTKTQTSVDGDVSFSVSGSYFGGSFGSVANSLSVYYRYKENGGNYCSNIALADVEIIDNTYTATFSVKALDYKKTYIFEAGASDKLITLNSSTKTVKFEPVFDWGENDFKFNVPVILPRSLYFDANGHGGLNVNNSDITGLNNLLFRDKSDGAGESIRFYKDGTNWDCLYITDGVVYITPNYPANSTSCVIFDPENKPYYEAGDSVTVNTIYPGWVSGGSKEFYFHIPLSKPILSDFSIEGSVVGRGINGYVLNSNSPRIDLTGGDGYYVSASKQANGIQIAIVYDKAQTAGITNNTPINWYGSVTITFISTSGVG